MRGAAMAGRHPQISRWNAWRSGVKFERIHTGRKYLVENVPSTNGVMRQKRLPDRFGPLAWRRRAPL
jgi:hypothetical protein